MHNVKMGWSSSTVSEEERNSDTNVVTALSRLRDVIRFSRSEKSVVCRTVIEGVIRCSVVPRQVLVHCQY